MRWTQDQLKNHPFRDQLLGLKPRQMPSVPDAVTPKSSLHIQAVAWKQGWHEIGGKRHYYKSRWEVNYACYLEFLKKANEIVEWEYEPETFWFEGIKRGTCSYKPDFKVTWKDGHTDWHEVKGWMDPRSKTKIKRMAKYHPTVKLLVIDSAWFKAHKNLNGFIPGWA